MKLIIEDSDIGKRVDLFISEKMSDFSRSQIKTAIINNAVTVDKKFVKPSYKLREGNTTVVVEKKLLFGNQKDNKLKAEKNPLKIIYEDKNIIVIDKPKNMVVHPGAGNQKHTLVNALLNHYPKIISAVHNNDKISLERPGIVHRLDKDTSGVLAVAKNKKSLKYLSQQLKKGTFNKYYLALCYGWLPENGRIESFLSRDKKNRKKITEVEKEFGKKAILKYTSRKYYETKKEKITLAEIKILTGRTHQIRVQLKGIGFPVIGDQIYYTKESKKISNIIGAKRQMLHAFKIELQLEDSNKLSKFESKLPDDFCEVIKKLTHL